MSNEMDITPENLEYCEKHEGNYVSGDECLECCKEAPELPGFEGTRAALAGLTIIKQGDG